MNWYFYISGVVAIIAALMVVTRANAMHALLYLVTLFLAIASIFWTLGAPFLAALQIIIYAGAIMVLFVFVVMMLNIPNEAQRERTSLRSLIWVLPAILVLILLIQFILAVGAHGAPAGAVISAKAVGRSLFTEYVIGVELASLLLLAGLIAAFHFGVLPERLESPND